MIVNKLIGKAVNQIPKTIKRDEFARDADGCIIGSYTYVDCYCEKCGKKTDFPDNSELVMSGQVFNLYTYPINSNLFIFETKKGRAITYCSMNCLVAHNHRASNDSGTQEFLAEYGKAVILSYGEMKLNLNRSLLSTKCDFDDKQFEEIKI